MTGNETIRISRDHPIPYDPSTWGCATLGTARYAPTPNPKPHKKRTRTMSDMSKRNTEAEGESSNSSFDESSDGYGNKLERPVEGERGEGTAAIAKKETKAVLWFRVLVLAVLVGSALAVALVTFFYVSKSEASQFKHKFRDDSAKILDSIGSNIARTLAIYDGLAVQLISSAKASGDEWPFTTMANFGIRLSKAYPLSHAVSINVLPIVLPEQRKEWEAYSVNHDEWVNESMAIQETWDKYYGPVVYDWVPNGVIFGDAGDIPYNESRMFLPIWQTYPAIPSYVPPYNWDWLSSVNQRGISNCIEKHQAVISDPYMIPTPNDADEQEETNAWADWFREYLPPNLEPIEPVSNFLYPIIDDLSRVVLANGFQHQPHKVKTAGVIAADFYWREMLRGILPTDSNGIDVVFDNPCTESFTYRIQGPSPVYRGVGDKHEEQYSYLMATKSLAEVVLNASHVGDYSGVPLNTEYCQSTIRVYPSREMESSHTTTNRVIFTICAVLIFGFTSLVFVFYDATVERRQKIVMRTAVRSTAIVTSLFPVDVRDRIYDDTERVQQNARASILRFTGNIKTSHESANVEGDMFSSSPIAELYPDTTVLFADIAGFTAWSSERVPTQVFTLLETVYYSFDVIAKQRGVFKVETIGDSYVAVVGLPTPKDKHALVMARFAKDIRSKMAEVVRNLATTLGPGTADLSLRIGLHSGPTTAGVLRGEKSRFQLFGDTVNTAARMESNGERGKIQVSQKTADLIRASGKGHWLTPRADKINAKGKGLLQTYWCEPRSTAEGGGSVVSSQHSASEQEYEGREPMESSQRDAICRLVDWHVDLFQVLLMEILRQRDETGDAAMPWDGTANVGAVPVAANSGRTQSSCLLPASAKDQLQELIESIAALYHTNDFHNFAHCSHVVMSAKKLLSNVTAPDDESASSTQLQTCAALNDPLTQFAIVFAALIHDVDHPGVANAQQVKEQTVVSMRYGGKSVAEQNSIVVAWQMFLEPKYKDLRACLFVGMDDMRRFRQIVVNAVMATDLFDSDLSCTRKARWENTFVSMDSSLSHDNDEFANERLTAAIELIIQVADVSHTMQHFSVYQKWNKRLLSEMHAAFTTGRGEGDPLINWYDSELWFLDNYVIPLAKKVQISGLFGVLGQEFVGHAEDNRIEWEATGRGILREATSTLNSR